MIAGLALKAYSALSPSPAREQAANVAAAPRSPLANMLAPANPPSTSGSASPSAEPSSRDWSADDWSVVLFPLGFSFVVGFAMGFAARQFLRITMVTAGIALLGLFGLQYAGLIEVNWSSIEGHYDAAFAWIATQTEGFREFVTGQIPSATSAAAGLWVGFRKR
jgi:uncharacterized membrane protein (Fun14 family)